jgi:hypothetical protein
VVGDQREAFALESAFAAYRLRYMSLPWTQPNKVAAVDRISSWLRDGVLSLPGKEPLTDELKRQLLQFDQRILPSGAITFGGRGATHDDLAALIVTAAIADTNGQLYATPYRRQSVYDLSALRPMR